LEPNQSVGLADSEALFAKELCDLLASLEAITLGLPRRFFASCRRGKIKKVKEYLRSKKCGAIRKAFATT
jgi:hypothetical protein